MQFAFRFAPPWRGAAISVPSAALMLAAPASFMVDFAKADWRAVALFGGAGILFPAAVTLLSMESNKHMGPNVAGAVGNTAPLFAVLFAVLALDEALYVLQAAGVVAIVGGITLLTLDRRRGVGAWPMWLLILPLAGAVLRGLAPPAIKIGLGWWPDAFAAAAIGYSVSAVVLVTAARLRAGGRLPRVEPVGRLWFATLGVCNGLSVLLIYAALLHAPVTLVSPLFATYPLVTLALARLVLRHEPFGPRIAAGVAATVFGVVALIAGHG